ncbi:MAG: hypothetical protein HQK83_06220 [Fibrobacteria bacterium]|nr:hypothetical protein [Fibrobacteria bacterium]
MFSLNGLSNFTNSTTALDFVALKNNQLQSRATSIFSGLASFSGNLGSPLSTNLLQQVYDAKALTAKTLTNYLDKANSYNSYWSSPDPPSTVSEKDDIRTIVDEIIEKYNTDAIENTDSEVIAAEPESDSETDTEANTDNTLSHFGIVGEIFDKYA